MQQIINKQYLRGLPVCEIGAVFKSLLRTILQTLIILTTYEFVLRAGHFTEVDLCANYCDTYGKLTSVTTDDSRAKHIKTDVEKKECRWCLSSNIQKVAVGAKARWIVEVPSSTEISYLFKCNDCDLVFFSSSFSDVELSRMYSGYRNSDYQRRRAKYEPWYSKKQNDAIGHSAEVLTLRRQHLEDTLSTALQNHPEKTISPIRVLDVGGDEGQFIPRMESITQKAVLEISGVRPVDGAQVLDSWNQAHDFLPDMIMMCHVLEHIETARENIENASRILKPGSLLYIEIPLDRPLNISRLFSTPLYMKYTKFLCKATPFFVIADLLSLISRRFLGRPIPGAVIKQNEHINFFDGATINFVVETFGFELIHESIYKPSSGVPVLDVSASGTLFVRK
jgi:SAM-dependent methyltransferase